MTEFETLKKFTLAICAKQSLADYQAEYGELTHEDKQVWTDLEKEIRELESKGLIVEYPSD